MSQARVVEAALEQFVTEHHITDPDDVAYWHRRADELISYALAYVQEHPLPNRWVDDPHA